MSFSRLPVSYCGNVHPSLSAGALREHLASYAGAIAAKVEQPIAVGLWLPSSIISEIRADGEVIGSIKSALSALGLSCYTLNAFPYGNFHSERVKEEVYLPDWTTGERLDYTIACANVLAELLEDGVEGSLSTLPLGFKRLSLAGGFLEKTQEHLLALARALDELHDQTGKVIRLAVEPEPLCYLETTEEAIAWYQSLKEVASETGEEDILQRHIGLCVDICHQAVEFESLTSCIERIDDAGIRINKVHLSSALEVPLEHAREAMLSELARFEEPRYLHQTTLLQSSGQIERMEDLNHATISHLKTTDGQVARVHFHVPVHQATMGALLTTQPHVREALEAVGKLDYAPHLEIETYTWSVLKPSDQASIVSGIAEEFRFVHGLLGELRG